MISKPWSSDNNFILGFGFPFNDPTYLKLDVPSHFLVKFKRLHDLLYCKNSWKPFSTRKVDVYTNFKGKETKRNTFALHGQSKKYVIIDHDDFKILNLSSNIHFTIMI